jgi:MFS family permease
MGYFQFLRQNARWLAAGMLLTLSSSYGQTFFISIFAGEIRAEFGLSNGAWGGIYTLGTSASAAVMIWGGTLTDRFRVRSLGPVMLALLAASSLAMASVSAAWALVLVIFALRFTGQGMTSHIAMVAMARWFVATRGRAMSLASLGFAIGTAALPLIFVALLTVMNWRMLWVVAAGLALIAIPVLWGLLRHERTPQSIAKDASATGMGGRHWTRRQILHHWLFWLMVPTLLGPAAWGTALFFQQVHLAQVKGWDHLEFVALFPLFTAALIVSTVATGMLIDRFGANRLMPFYLLPLAAGFVVISLAGTLTGAAVGMVLVGLGNGIGSSLPGAFWAEHCGSRNLGSIKAMAAAVMVFGSAIGPGVSGWLIDQGMNFPEQMMWMALYFIVAALLATIAAIKARRLLFVTP